MKLLIVTTPSNHYLFRVLCAQIIVTEVFFCDYVEAMELLLVEGPSHVLFDIDGDGNVKESAKYLRDLQQSATPEQAVFCTSFMRLADTGAEIEQRRFLRKPYLPETLAAFLSGAG